MVPPGADAFGDSVAFVRSKGSTELVMALLKAVGHPTRNNDLHLIAEAMKPEEIRAGVEQKLGCMAEVLTAGSQAAPAP